jgi:hypothetical protein
MCHERYWHRRYEETDEGRRLWMDFDLTEPVDEPERPEEPDVEFAERRREEVVAADR